MQPEILHIITLQASTGSNYKQVNSNKCTVVYPSQLLFKCDSIDWPSVPHPPHPESSYPPPLSYQRTFFFCLHIKCSTQSSFVLWLLALKSLILLIQQFMLPRRQLCPIQSQVFSTSLSSIQSQCSFERINLTW